MIGNQLFLGPYKDKEFIRKVAGVYVIVCKTGKNSYKVIDVGESEDVNDRLKFHDRELSWKLCCDDIWYSYLPIDDEISRCNLEKNIRQKYNPDCGER